MRTLSFRSKKLQKKFKISSFKSWKKLKLYIIKETKIQCPMHARSLLYSKQCK